MKQKQSPRITEREIHAFENQNHPVVIPILSFTPEACIIRAFGRIKVDKLFRRSHQVFRFNPAQGWALNKEARELWHKIVAESNKH